MQKPFEGITFCPTALPEELSRSVSRKIIKLGGTFSKDLTKFVNVLVVGSVATNKYRFAVQHRDDLVMVDSDALDAIYELWLSGEDVTMESHSHFAVISGSKDRMLEVLSERYRLKPLKNFCVFIGRITDDCGGRVDVAQLEKACNRCGVQSCNSRHFVKEPHWDKPTVFVTDYPHGARVEAARDQGLPIIHPKWILDCERRGALLEFSFYQIDDVLGEAWESIGAGACFCWSDVEQRIDKNAVSGNGDGKPQNLSQRSILGKYGSHGVKLWNNVLHREPKASESLETPEPAAKSVAEEDMIFQDMNFCIAYFTERHSLILSKIITRNGGGCTDKTDSTSSTGSTYLLVPSNRPKEALGDTTAFGQVVTEFYIERCLHYKTALPVDSWSEPFFTRFQLNFPHRLVRAGSEQTNLNVAITGFQGVELLHISKILEYLSGMGITFCENLNRQTDTLLINLGSLSSIPETHTLRHNKYASLFVESQKVKVNQVFRNSMKRKIEFIKQKHNIPVMTPGFLLELFARASKLKEASVLNSVTNIYMNDINWSVLCPKGNKDDYKCEIRATSSMETSSLEKPAKRKIPDFHAEQQLSNHKIPRLQPEGNIEPVKRSVSWGKMMSEQVCKVNELQNSASESETEPEDNLHTQVTYGIQKDGNNGKSSPVASSKRLTRQVIRQIGV
ncbi:LAMI_0H07756g1_1 [Lachancea mirantina]|uniref:LAMI_0H07756g1_1 n=1 Tax=Lachancea mirantina TaxID=1230905 RepID=A0A1G4KFP3_9SACH|nr:LAMI_0H07756g1_1 [Lachancea mirantina]